ncbi:hypothetical protein Tco_0779141 [Tanacetum coccineum]
MGTSLPLNLDSLKSWNKHFFCIDASIYPISLSWFDIHSVERDLLPFDDVVDLNLIDRLNEGRAAIRKYLEIFLSVVGLSRSFVEEDVRPTFIGPNRCGRYHLQGASLPVRLPYEEVNYGRIVG